MKLGLQMMTHLPLSDDEKDIKTCLDFIKMAPSEVRIYPTLVLKDTCLCDMYEKGEYAPPTMNEYIDSVVYILTHISPRVIVHRLTGDCPRDMLVAPAWNGSKSEIINTIVYKMQQKGLSQGCEY